MAAARAVVEEALDGRGADLRGHDRLRALRLDPRCPASCPRSCSSACCGATPAASASRTREEIVRAAMLMRANALAKGYSGTRVEVAELLLECLGRGRDPGGAEPGLRRCERRPGTAGPPRASARRRGAGLGRGRAALRSRRARRGRAASRCGCRRRKGCRSSTGRSSWARSRRSGSCGQRRLAEDGGRRLRAVRRRAPGLARELPAAASTSCVRSPGQAASAANILRLLEGSAIIEAHRWCDRVQDAYSLRCARSGARRVARPARVRRARRSRSSSTRRPTIRSSSPRTGRSLSNGNFHGQPLAFALDALAMARQRAGEHLRAADRAAREPRALRRPARVPRDRRRAQLRVHDPAVRGRRRSSARTRRSAIRRASTRSRRARARRITSRWATPRG